MSRQILTENQLNKLLSKTTKGFVSELTKVTEKMLKQNTKTYLYGENHVNTKKKTYKNSKGILYSITYDKTDNLGDSFYNRVYFDIDVIEKYSSKKTKEYLGTYTDVYGNFVGDDLISDGWLEYGSNGIVPRSGAYMIETTIEEITQWLSSSNVDIYFQSELGDIIVEKFK